MQLYFLTIQLCLPRLLVLTSDTFGELEARAANPAIVQGPARHPDPLSKGPGIYDSSRVTLQ